MKPNAQRSGLLILALAFGVAGLATASVAKPKRPESASGRVCSHAPTESEAAQCCEAFRLDCREACRATDKGCPTRCDQEADQCARDSGLIHAPAPGGRPSGPAISEPRRPSGALEGRAPPRVQERAR